MSLMKAWARIGTITLLLCGTLDVTAASYSIYHLLLLLGICFTEAFNPVQAWALYAIVLELSNEIRVWDNIQSFAEVHYG